MPLNNLLRNIIRVSVPAERGHTTYFLFGSPLIEMSDDGIEPETDFFLIRFILLVKFV